MMFGKEKVETFISKSPKSGNPWPLLEKVKISDELYSPLVNKKNDGFYYDAEENKRIYKNIPIKQNEIRLSSPSISLLQMEHFARGPYNSLPLVFTKLTTSGDKVTVGSHSGSLGLFVSSSSYTVYKQTYIDQTNGHTFMSTSALSSSGTSFSIMFVQQS